MGKDLAWYEADRMGQGMKAEQPKTDRQVIDRNALELMESRKKLRRGALIAAMTAGTSAIGGIWTAVADKTSGQGFHTAPIVVCSTFLVAWSGFVAIRFSGSAAKVKAALPDIRIQDRKK